MTAPGALPEITGVLESYGVVVPSGGGPDFRCGRGLGAFHRAVGSKNMPKGIILWWRVSRS
ncbi:hypothetical protein A6M21_15055 [Desulfotomaculum copahuensis]|uniref:Uncharacterized protein n=1 Tax=Desulfotomaculum copahuensis TaxID=1838280 RepID=A0A1B7LBA5_9FIRM|nr:hypothetical protein A6M21_15055 [Desulfotomaculum copahuensis]